MVPAGNEQHKQNQGSTEIHSVFEQSEAVLDRCRAKFETTEKIRLKVRQESVCRDYVVIKKLKGKLLYGFKEVTNYHIGMVSRSLRHVDVRQGEAKLTALA